jgi:hypothetical protein
LEAIREYWVQSPDLRLAQIIVNVAPTGNPCPHVFYMEDDYLLARLEEILPRPHVIAGQTTDDGRRTTDD